MIPSLYKNPLVATRIVISSFNNREQSWFLPETRQNEKMVALINASQREDYTEMMTILTRIVNDKTKLTTKNMEQLLEVMLAQPSEDLFKFFLDKFDEEIKELSIKDGGLLHLVASRNIYTHVQPILDSGIVFDEINRYGETPLFTAIRYGRLEFVQNYIGQYGASVLRININIKEHNKQFNPLSYAVFWDHPEIVSCLLDRDEVEIGGKLGGILELVVELERYTVLTILLVHKKVLDTHKNNSSLIARAFAHAAYLSRPQILKNLACQFPDVAQNIKDRDYLPIHRAIDSPNPKLEVLETINCLRNLGVNITQHDQYGHDAIAYVNKLLEEIKDKEKKAKDENDQESIEECKVSKGKYEAIRNVLRNNIEAVYANQYRLLHCKVDDVEALVFSGGGPKGVAYIGVLEQLSHLMSMTKDAANFNKIRYIAGTSAGAITAGLLAVGYTPKELRTELLQQPILDFVDNKVASLLIEDINKTKFQSLANMATRYYEGAITGKDFISFIKNLTEGNGLCPGEEFLKWIEGCICKKIAAITKQDEQKYKCLTFGELKELRAKHKEIKDLYIVTTNLSGNEPEIRVFSSEDESSKNNIISYTIRASMSIPILFNIAHEYIKHNGKPQAINSTYYVDGGLIRNRPIDIFDKSKYVKAGLSSEKQDYPVYNERVIGFVLNEEVVENREQDSTFTTQDYLLRLASTYYNAERILTNTKANNNRIIAVNCGRVNMLSFNLSEEEKNTLINAGAEAVRDFFPLGPQ